MLTISTQGGAKVTERMLGDGVSQLIVSTRVLRRPPFVSTCYLVGDLMVDTSFARARAAMTRVMAGRPVRAICCTHNHEDHAGNCGPLSRLLDCPVYLRNPQRAWLEGVRPMPLYRRLSWGVPPSYAPEAMPEQIRGDQHTLVAVPTPGHSQTHTVLFEPAHGLLFVGDLYLSGGVTGVMAHENPYETICSLRRAADLSPRRLLNGHGLVADQAEERLRLKANRIEAATEQVAQMARAGLDERQTVARLFHSGRLRDRLGQLLTGGEFSRLNFVRACLRHAQDNRI